MNGHDVLVSGLKQACDRFYAVPGYPVTGIAESVSAEIVVNEKVGLEYALGDSLAGRRACLIIKNVGLNACADPLVNATTQGLSAGVVVISGDDVDAAGSQNAQDSRYYGEVAQIPVLEPDSEILGPAVEEAFSASERFSRIALLRITPPVLERTSGTSIYRRKPGSGNLAQPALTMRGRVQAADRITAEMFEWARSHPFNHLNKGPVKVGGALGAGDSRAFCIYPPPGTPEQLSATRELGRPFLHEHRCATPPAISEPTETYEIRGFYRTFCRGCPFHSVLGLIKERGMQVVCDMGCSLLAQNPPYRVGIASYGLGSSVAVAARSTGIALCGDYAMLHSGINALIDVYEKELPLLCIILNNRRMGMTGGQSAPDILPYIKWADPVVLDATGDAGGLAREMVPRGTPKTLIIEGICPEGERHETVEC